MKIAVLISANAEWETVKFLIPNVQLIDTPFGESFNLTLDPHGRNEAGEWQLVLLHSGWGKISSAAVLQYVLDRVSPDLTINLGTCGGFEGVIDRGEVILVEKTFVYDILELMEGKDISAFYASTLDLSWLAEPYPFPVRRGTVASADSDLLPERIPFLKSKGALAADWESATLAWVAQKNKSRLLILRAVSDVVGGQASDAYNNYDVFKARTREIMKQLFDQLPGWLNAVLL